MKSALKVLLGVILLPGLSLLAEEKNGVRLSVQKTTLDKIKADRSSYWDKVDKSLALRVNIKNTSLKDRPAGRITYDVIVRRHVSEELENFSDSVELEALPKGKDIEKELGNIQMSGYENVSNRREYMDSIEAWKVTITHDGVETVSAVSGGDYERLSKAIARRKK